MRRNNRQTARLAMILVLSWLTANPSSAQTEDPYAFDDQYESGDFGRVTYQENGVTIHRAMADPGLPPVSEAGVNSPVYPGDALLTSADQRVEVQVASGSLIRIDRATDVTFLGLPDPYAEFPDNTVLQLAEGTLRLATRLTEGEEFRVDTPSSSIYLLGDGDFRIEVTPGGRTEVISRRGVAEVVGNGGSILVQGGMRTEVFPGTLPEEAWAFNTFVTDNFDRWVDDRDAIYLVRDRYPGAPEYSAEAYEALPEEVQPYYQELSHHGDWTYVEEYGHVWYPSAAPADWRPYYDGYWDYGPGGYFWVSNEPWGWAPYHYGRWNWVAGYGWCWVPGRVFSGAWVAWSWGSAHIGWAPIDYWGRPCSVRGIYYGYYDPHAWTFVGYEHVARRNYHRHAVRIDDIGADIRHARVVTRPPRVSPERLATSPEARSRAMRMVEADGAGRMRPVDRTSRPSLTMRDVERRIRGRSNATRRGGDGNIGARDGAGPSVRRETVRTGDRQSTGRSPATDRRSTAREGNYPSYPRRLSQDRTSGDDDSRRDVGRRRSESARRAEDRSGAGNLAPSAPRVRPRETERAGTDQHVRDLYRKMANPRSTRDGNRSGGSGSSTTRTTDRKRDSGRSPGPSATVRRSPGAKASQPSSPRQSTRVSTPSRPSTPRSTTRTPAPKRPSTPRSTTRTPAPKRPSTPRSTTRSSAPKRTSTPRSTTRSSAPKRPSTPRSTGSKTGSSKSTSGGKSKSNSDRQSGSRGKKK